MQIPSIFTAPTSWRPWLVNGLLLALLICLLIGCVPPPPRAGHAPAAPPHPSALNHLPAKTGDGTLSGASAPTNIFGNLQV